MTKTVWPLLFASLLSGCDGCRPTTEEPSANAERPRMQKLREMVGRNLGGQPQTVLFVVLDTVRADHTSLCGYDRPTTPRLEAMRGAGAAVSCNTYSPAPWTLPSHASMFTGTSVTEHATMFVSDSDVAINSTITARPLADSFETLAEIYRARGYQTVAISANSILNQASGLLQGFDATDISSNGMTMRMRGMSSVLSTRLEALDPDKPLFLFVNIYDAHDPYPPIPEPPTYQDWLPAQPRVVLDAYTHSPDNPYFAFIKGLMPEEEQGAFLQRITDGYDWGIYIADTNLAVISTMLLRAGWFKGGYRMVVTSDHGEFLGEHQLLRHSGFLWEPGVKVPLVFLDTTRRRQPVLPDPMSGIDIFHLVKDGKLPATPTPPHSVSEKNPADILVGTVAGAAWNRQGHKAMCVDGERARYDLQADPAELEPLPVGDDALGTGLDTLCAAVDALQELPAPTGVDPSLSAALQAMGYVSPDEPTADELPQMPKGR